MADTIVALATPPGISGIAVIRLSGDDAIDIASSCFKGKIDLRNSPTHRIYYGKIVNNSECIDDVTLSIFRKPNSYTGEDVVEISCHGGMIIYNEIIKKLIHNGARLAQPGEYTKRAFINGKMDLLQAEAVADLINSVSYISEQTSARQLFGEFTKQISKFRKDLIDIASLLEIELDFTDEDVEFVSKTKVKNKVIEIINFAQILIDSYKTAQILRSGYFVAIVGYPNSGKSTLFNTLLKKNRAIVSEIPGTTRDYLEEFIYLNDIPIKLIDTAGIRQTTDIIEIEGIKFVESLLEQSNLILVLNDASISMDNSNNLYNELNKRYTSANTLLIQNKIDKIINIGNFEKTENEIYISAKLGTGIDKLTKVISENAIKSISREQDILLNLRHYAILEKVKKNLEDALKSINDNMGNEFIAIDIRSALNHLGELTGEVYNEEILNNIFSKFCIGK
ncbi:MAG TPA: tRNA uridine-5-carboxymethylaminomethyl(34) synthesis GTPase MnmE [Candidatus Kapabacteria bacterium]|nr:tRNA uridine-5-carboxymethylaminomethyl(34) synthesis GTPase MnmE [Candidatus Kapabacteria bacterium]HOV92722.1 tRNA uridine-5-carboxymethylaminomethyl(34) synthesis GTPase MnmE [Candidatus Kapabacteria bacterium]